MGQLKGSGFYIICPMQSIEFTSFRAKGQFIYKYFEIFIKRDVYEEMHI